MHTNRGNIFSTLLKVWAFVALVVFTITPSFAYPISISLIRPPFLNLPPDITKIKCTQKAAKLCFNLGHISKKDPHCDYWEATTVTQACIDEYNACIAAC